jgi:hypothetical protein
VCLKLTESGRDVYLQARVSAEQRMSRIIERLSAGERRSLFRGLEALRLALTGIGRSGSEGRGRAVYESAISVGDAIGSHD